MHIHLQYIECLYSYICVNVTEGKFRGSKEGFCGFSFFFLLRAESGKSVCDALCFLWEVPCTILGCAFKKALLWKVPCCHSYFILTSG